MTRRGLAGLSALTLALGVTIVSVWRASDRSLSSGSTAPNAPSAISTAPAPSATIVRPSGDASAEVMAIDPELTTLEDEDGFRLLTFTIPLEKMRIRVVDLDMRRVLAPTVDELGATLVVNGGFFDPSRRPDGLVISEGKLVAPVRAELGGGVFTLAGERAAIVAAESFSMDAGPLDFAVQCRPRLVVASARNVKGDDGPKAERTALCLRDHARTLEVVVARGETAGVGPTLGLFADMLLSRGCEDALNLDGGPSTGVAWLRKSEGGIVELAPRGGVRHGIAIWGSRSDAR